MVEYKPNWTGFLVYTIIAVFALFFPRPDNVVLKWSIAAVTVGFIIWFTGFPQHFKWAYKKIEDLPPPEVPK